MPKRSFEISRLDNNGIVATSAANAMLECIRVVSPEPLIVPVSSNGALFGELGQETGPMRGVRCQPISDF